jgi:glutathione S-transferase
MIDVYFWPTGNGKKITIVLEECGVPYNVIPVNINKGEPSGPQYEAIDPNNRMPAIVDHSAAGGPVTVFESGAILQYLAEKTGKLLPADTAGKYRVLQWVYWQGQDLDDYPNVKRWFDTVGARPAVRKGADVGKELTDFSQPPAAEERMRLFHLP